MKIEKEVSILKGSNIITRIITNALSIAMEEGVESASSYLKNSFDEVDFKRCSVDVLVHLGFSNYAEITDGGNNTKTVMFMPTYLFSCISEDTEVYTREGTKCKIKDADKTSSGGFMSFGFLVA